MIRLFISYSHRDEKLRNELETHLAALKQQGIIETWHDRCIGAGKELDNEISENLDNADIILLLVSSYFIASKYCYGVEMARAMQRHESGEARVIPVILRPSYWHSLPFGRLLATPKNGKPVTKFRDRHTAFVDVTEAIHGAAEELDVAKRRGGQRVAKGAGAGTSSNSSVTSPRSSRKLKVYTRSPQDSFGSLSWTRDRAKAKDSWDKFWTEYLEVSEDRATLQADDYRQLYITKFGTDHVGSEDPSEPPRHTLADLRGKIRIDNLLAPGGEYERRRGVNTTRFDGFDDDGVGYKEIPEEHLADYVRPLPQIRKF